MRYLIAILAVLLAACAQESPSVLRARADDIERRERAVTAEAVRVAATQNAALAIQVATQAAWDRAATEAARPTNTATATATDTPMPTATVTMQPSATSTAQPATATIEVSAAERVATVVVLRETAVLQPATRSEVDNPLFPIAGIGLILLALAIGIFVTRKRQ